MYIVKMIPFGYQRIAEPEFKSLVSKGAFGSRKLTDAIPVIYKYH